MNLILVSREDAESSLAHYRVGGEKKGVLRWQNKDGSLTPAGYQHYAEMYGWGKKRGPRNKADGAKSKKDEKKSEKEYIRKIREKIEASKSRKRAKAEARAAQKEAEEKKQKEDQKGIRDLSDKELNDRIARLQKEKQYSELLNERSNREKGAFRSTASKLFKEAAENLARKALNELVDDVINKTKARVAEKSKINLGDYKDVDPYSLDSEKLKAVSAAFSDAAKLIKDKNTIDNLAKKAKGSAKPDSTKSDKGDSSGDKPSTDTGGGKKKSKGGKGDDSSDEGGFAVTYDSNRQGKQNRGSEERQGFSNYVNASVNKEAKDRWTNMMTDLRNFRESFDTSFSNSRGKKENQPKAPSRILNRGTDFRGDYIAPETKSGSKKSGDVGSDYRDRVKSSNNSLTDSQKSKISSLFKSGESITDLADKYDVSESTIKRYIKFKDIKK